MTSAFMQVQYDSECKINSICNTLIKQNTITHVDIQRIAVSVT